jgi:hypothetical protein
MHAKKSRRGENGEGGGGEGEGEGWEGKGVPYDDIWLVSLSLRILGKGEIKQL